MKLRSTVSMFATLAMSGSLFVACGGDATDDGTTDDDGGTPVGDHNKYVVDSIDAPESAAEASALGLDVDGDGTVDNQLGMVLATLGSQGIETQPSLDASVANGGIILLADIQTTGFDSAANAGFSLYIGDNASPAPCTDVADPTTCGQHLDGTGTFDIKAGTPTDGTVVGAFSGGVYTAGSPTSTLHLQIALGTGEPIDIDLVGARAKISSSSATAIDEGIVAGGVLKSDIDNKILPAVVDIIAPIMAMDCVINGPACDCTAGSSGETIQNLFDDDNNCDVTLAEIQGNAIISSLLAPDADIDGDGTKEALSLGVGITAVTGVYTGP